MVALAQLVGVRVQQEQVVALAQGQVVVRAQAVGVQGQGQEALLELVQEMMELEWAAQLQVQVS